jgi:hypothetical protein
MLKAFRDHLQMHVRQVQNAVAALRRLMRGSH